MISFFALFVLSYLIGSFNTSIVYSLTNFKKDIRSQGSGNAGATNMLRNFGTISAVITFLGDILKAVLAIGIAWLVFKNSECLSLIKALIGLACVIGHCFPIFFGFKGGKGISTGAGCILMLDWRVFLIILAVFALIVLIFRYVSLGSIIAAVLFPLGMLIVGLPPATVIISAIISLIVIWRHKENIARLCNKTEHKIGSNHKERSNEK